MADWKQVRRFKESRGHLEAPFGKMGNDTDEELVKGLQVILKTL